MNEIMYLSWFFHGAAETGLLGGREKEWFSKHSAFQLLPFPFSLKQRM